MPPAPRGVRLTPPNKGKEEEKNPETVPNPRLSLPRATSAQDAVPRAPAEVAETFDEIDEHGGLEGAGESDGL